MEAGELLGAVVVGIAAGAASGLLGIGGGVLFVPGLVLFLDQTVLEAEATSLVAIVMVAVVGAWRQREYGNLRLRDAAIIGALSPVGVIAGTAAANAISDRALEVSFACVQLYFAFELVRRARATGGDGEAEPA